MALHRRLPLLERDLGRLLQVLDREIVAASTRLLQAADDLLGRFQIGSTRQGLAGLLERTQIGLGGNEAPREGAFCDLTVRTGDTLIVEDASVDDYFADNPFVVGDPHLRFYAGQPLQAPGGEHVGTLCILDTQPRTLDARDIELLREMATWVQKELMAEDDLDLATVVQRALLPDGSPEVPGYTLAGAAIASGQLMGDMYDWYLLG